MNIENFKEFLENPSRLYQLSYQELKSLVLQYPYSTNLHYLLLQKSAMEDHRELEQNRQKAAAYSIDRTFLFHLLKELAQAGHKEPLLKLDEDFLELKDLSFLEIDASSSEPAEERQQIFPGVFPGADLPDLNIEMPEEKAGEGEKILDLSFSDPPPSPAEPIVEIFEKEAEETSPAVVDPILSQSREEAPGTPQPEESEATPPPSYRAPHSLILGAVSVVRIAGQVNAARPKEEIPDTAPASPPAAPAAVEDHGESPSLDMQKQLLDKLNSLIQERAMAAVAVKKPAPQPKVNFTSWVQQFQPDHVKQQLSDIMEAKKRDELKRLNKKQKKNRKKKKKSSKDQRIVKFAEQSLTSHQTIVSETLAELLAEQGETQKSIEMYERLKLFFPEKSTYFAAIIEKLKTK
jgi:hypothetical protein